MVLWTTTVGILVDMLKCDLHAVYMRQNSRYLGNDNNFVFPSNTSEPEKSANVLESSFLSRRRQYPWYEMSLPSLHNQFDSNNETLSIKITMKFLFGKEGAFLFLASASYCAEAFSSWGRQASAHSHAFQLCETKEGPTLLEESEFYTKNTKSYTCVQEVLVSELDTLRGKFPSFENENDIGSNVIKKNKRSRGIVGQEVLMQVEEDFLEDTESHLANVEYNELLDEDELVLVDLIRKPGMPSVSRAFHRAGPRKQLHFDPSKVNAAIVTCGGLCPGLNNVIRELTHSLKYLYGADTVWGVRGGFNGFHNPEYPPIELTSELVENIHHEGGSILRSSRGGFDIEKIMAFIEEKDIDMIFVIGGDGTHRGAFALSQACIENNLNVAVAGIPKTIDNDVDYIDRSFGFKSAVEAAQAAIKSAKTEAMCTIPNGVGIIKIMGRSAGYLAAYAALGSGDVDVVLIPEVPIVMDGPNGVLPFIRKRVQEQKFAVVVLAEGCGEDILGTSEETDAGGNRKLPKIGEYMQEQVTKYFESFGERASIKYIDPSYTVRSVPANAEDTLYCMQLAQNAVHGAMAGLTGFSTGLVNNKMVYLPIPQLVASSPRSMNAYGRTYERILTMTGQPNLAPPQDDDEHDFLCGLDPDMCSF